MRSLLLAAFLAAAALPVRALNSWGTDMSDLWWVPAESGWGINISHQRDTIFATIFVYGPDNRARWYVAPAMVAPDPNVTQTAVTYPFSGKLYETQGPPLTTGFNPTAVTNREVGTIAINFYEVGKGTLTYGVDSTLVTKEIRRQTFKRNDIAGFYFGASVATGFACDVFSNPILAGNGDIVVALVDSIAQIQMQGSLSRRCNVTGLYEQQGRMGVITGSYTCSGGVPNGNFTAFEVEAGYSAISMRYVAQYGNCVEAGRLAGVRR